MLVTAGFGSPLLVTAGFGGVPSGSSPPAASGPCVVTGGLGGVLLVTAGFGGAATGGIPSPTATPYGSSDPTAAALLYLDRPDSSLISTDPLAARLLDRWTI